MGKNVTLKLDEAVLRKAKHLAVEKDQSLSEWVANMITSAVSKNDRAFVARKRAKKRLKKGFQLGGRLFDREQLHER